MLSQNIAKLIIDSLVLITRLEAKKREHTANHYSHHILSNQGRGKMHQIFGANFEIKNTVIPRVGRDPNSQ